MSQRTEPLSPKTSSFRPLVLSAEKSSTLDLSENPTTESSGTMMSLLIQPLDGQNRQSPIASDFGSRTQIAALFTILLYRSV